MCFEVENVIGLWILGGCRREGSPATSVSVWPSLGWRQGLWEHMGSRWAGPVVLHCSVSPRLGGRVLVRLDPHSVELH